MPILDDLLPYLPKGDPEHYIFSPDGGLSPITKSVDQRAWDRYTRKTGITCTAHQLRHSFATSLFDANIDVKIAADLLGHATEQMSRDRYKHIRNLRRQGDIDRLNASMRSKNGRKDGANP